jgi:tetraacyldisaccharide 4'-kinase
MDEAAFRKLISGNKRGVVPSAARGLLGGLSLFYGAGVRVRNGAFNIGVQRVHRASVPVVSVGNVTTGGTGKTPFVAYLANWFGEQDVRVAVLSRGYRSLPGEVNDEKLMLDQLCPDVPHLQNPDRVTSARLASDEHCAQLLLLDDGFQHRRLERDLDIVLVDALNPFGYGYLLPRGLLREPLSGLKRADVIVLTRTDQCSDGVAEQTIDRIGSIRGSDEHVEVAFTPDRLVNSAGETAEFESIHPEKIAAFCGIGNPDGFARTIADCGLRIADTLQKFPDHYHYTVNDLTAIGKQAKEKSVTAILTTRKDLVKIKRTELAGRPLWAVQIEVNIVAGAELLQTHLERMARLAGNPVLSEKPGF